MTTRNKASLTLLFEQADIPSGTDYADFIDSYVNVAETSAQTLLSSLTATELVSPRVSATAGIFTTVGVNTVSAVNIGVTTLQVAAAISAINAAAQVSSLRVGADVSAASGTVYASAMRATDGVLFPVTTISAAGSTQATAGLLTGVINRGIGVSAGEKTGFTPRANRAGMIQYLYNNGPSANLWPPVGGTINGLAANAAFALAASAAYTIAHLTASAYAVHG